MHVSLTLPSSWEDLSQNDGVFYFKKLVTDGPIIAASLLAERINRNTYKQVRRHAGQSGIALLTQNAINHLKWLEDAPITKPFISKMKEGLLPDEGLKMITVREYAYASDYLNDLQTTQDQLHTLKCLFCCLVRPKSSKRDYINTGDKRKLILSKEEIELRADSIAVEEWKLAYIVRFFVSNVQYIENMYGGYVFGNEPAEGLNLGWHGTVMTVAESNLYGKVNEVYDTPLHDFLAYLAKKNNDQEQANKATEKT